jgi:hypothetical protein
MMRLLGVLVGSALAVGALVVFIGIPEFTTENSVAGNTVITLPMRTEPATAVGPEPEPVTPVAEVPALPAPAAAAGDDDLPEMPEPVDDPAPEPETVAPLPVESIEDLQQWYAFWSPFRSEIAASGFVDQLQRVTGLDYRVVKVKPGVYEVAFAYSDDAEIINNLSQITAATGLQLPEG